MTNELDSPDGIPVEPPVYSESALTKPRRWRWFMAGVLSTILAVGGVVGVVEATKAKGVTPASKAPGATPASINAAMAKFCGKGSVSAAVGGSQVNGLMQSNAVASLSCTTSDETVHVWAYFYRTAFDENTTLAGGYAERYGSGYVSIGRGFIAFFGCWDRSCSPRMTEGQIVNWMTQTFGMEPVSRRFPVQRWTETLSPITLESFGSPKPILDKP